MSISAGYTNDEIRALVYEYQTLPHGARGEWLRGQPFSRHRFQRWQTAVLGGDIERGLIPREGSDMSTSRKNFRALAEQQQSVPKKRHDEEIAALQARIEALEGANEALGKAIGLLHNLSAQGSVTTQTVQIPSSFSRTKMP